MAAMLAQLSRDDAVEAIERIEPDVIEALNLAEAFLIGRHGQSQLTLTALQLGLLERAARLAIPMHDTSQQNFMRAAGEAYMRVKEGNSHGGHDHRQVPGGST
jgi:hypothetical protein